MRFFIILTVLLAIHLVNASDNGGIFSGDISTLLLSDINPASRKCRPSKVRSMIQVECDDRNLENIPKSLQSNVQILDFSRNRMRKITNQTFAEFTNLAFLYLTDNFIQKIEAGAFADHSYLQVLDVSKNGLSDFPKNILELPELKRLYLADNQLSDSSLVFCADSRLEFLEISRNLLTKIPSLQSLPQLQYLNVSENKITNIKPEELATFCTLKILDITNNPINTDNCDCQALNQWIELRNITLFPSKLKCSTKKCVINSTSSANSLISNEAIKIFKGCLEIIEIREDSKKSRSMLIKIAVTTGIFLIVLSIVLYVIHKRNEKGKHCKLKKEQALSANGANTELLNGVNNKADQA